MKIFKRIIIFTFSLFLLFLLLDYLYPLNLSMLKRDESPILYDRNNKIISMKISDEGFWHFEAKKDEIPKLLKQSVITFEDRYFYYHFGFNPFSIIRAFFLNLSGRKIGASTITMQVARMMNPKKRSYKNKIIEIFNAMQLEWHFSKDEILTMYFNLAPYGGNLVGVKSASYFYFGKSLDKLSIAQISLLSVIPKNPNKNRLDRISNINKLKNRLIKDLKDEKILSLSAYKRAKMEKFKNQRISRINYANDYSNIAFSHSLKKVWLDLDFQLELEKILKQEVKKLKDKGINNASAVLIDNKSMQILAYVGSQDKFAKNGQNDGVKYRKNVGSTLKPFIYAKALENGLITPNSLLVDTQIHYKNYTPKNYSEGFVGLVSAKDALKFSLNIPAIRLNDALGEDSLYELLKMAGFCKEDKEFYGQSLALGAIDLSLLDLTHLYTIFANNGKLLPLYFAGEKIDKNISILSPQSVYLIYQILKDSPRIYLDSVWKNTLYKPKIMFKTGTSANSRDLYAIGVSKEYTLGIWMGNFDATKTQDLSGGISSAEALLNMFDYLDKHSQIHEIDKVDKIESKKVCIDAFFNKTCKQEKDDLAILGLDLNRSCKFYKNEELFYMIKSGYLNENDVKNSECYDDFKDIAPVLNDIDGKEFITDKTDLRLKISCSGVFGDDVYINIDNLGYKEHKNNEDFFVNFAVGSHEVVCMDSYSNIKKANFNVVNLK